MNKIMSHAPPHLQIIKRCCFLSIGGDKWLSSSPKNGAHDFDVSLSVCLCGCLSVCLGIAHTVPKVTAAWDLSVLIRSSNMPELLPRFSLYAEIWGSCDQNVEDPFDRRTHACVRSSYFHGISSRFLSRKGLLWTYFWCLFFLVAGWANSNIKKVPNATWLNWTQRIWEIFSFYISSISIWHEKGRNVVWLIKTS